MCIKNIINFIIINIKIFIICLINNIFFIIIKSIKTKNIIICIINNIIFTIINIKN